MSAGRDPENNTRQRSGEGRPWHRLPAVRALAMQILSLLLVYGTAVLLARFAGVALSLMLLVLAQGIVAAALSRLVGLAAWWLPIQFAFLPLLSLAAMLQLPSVVYLAGFLVLLFLYWSTFRTQVPYYPSGPAGWRAVAAILPPGPLHVIDIGCGFGGMVRHLERARPDCSIEGIELAPLPCWSAALINKFTGNKSRIRRGDYQQLDFAGYDVVFAYLSPAAMPALWKKARAEMRPGTLLLSYEFMIPGVESQITNISPDDDRILHGWQM